jgi:hypothetical protein
MMSGHYLEMKEAEEITSKWDFFGLWEIKRKRPERRRK